MIDLLITLFKWPTGIVVGNLIASAMWATPVMWKFHKKLERHHAEQLRAIRAQGGKRERTM